MLLLLSPFSFSCPFVSLNNSEKFNAKLKASVHFNLSNTLVFDLQVNNDKYFIIFLSVLFFILFGPADVDNCFVLRNNCNSLHFWGVFFYIQTSYLLVLSATLTFQ